MANKPRIPYAPDYATRPGEVLEEQLAARGMTKAELAARCGRPTKTISEIIHGKAAITAETALQLARVLGHAPSLWQNLEANYRLQLAKQSEKKGLAKHAAWAKGFPVKELIAREVIEAPTDDVDLVGQILKLFGVGTREGWDASFGQPQVAYRRSAAFKAAPENLATWIRLGEIEAESLSCAPFSKALFKQALQEARGMTRHSFPEVQDQLIEKCAAAGVAVVLVPELPKAPLSGLARWLHKDKALIQLSLRYKRADHLWFSFFHEAGHILLHGKKTVFIDDGGNDKHELEEQANRFASDLLIPPDALADFIAQDNLSKRSVKAFAEEQGIAPGIVVGRLQHDKVVPFSHFHDLCERLVWS